MYCPKCPKCGSEYLSVARKGAVCVGSGGGGAAGGAKGAALGSIAGPVGMFVGAMAGMVIGAVAGSIAANKVGEIIDNTGGMHTCNNCGHRFKI